MIVLKFGGTSIGSPENMKNVLEILRRVEGPKVVVLSAMAGTTNDLTEIAGLAKNQRFKRALHRTDQLYTSYLSILSGLFEDTTRLSRALNLVNYRFDEIRDFLVSPFTEKEENEIIARGELISTDIFHLLCESEGQNSRLLPALAFMRIDQNGEPDFDEIYELIENFIPSDGMEEILITQGFICRDHHGNVGNLQRGGSDYSATILGSILNAEEIQIWTDIDGIHNNDPRIVDYTQPIRKLSYREAAELAYFGAKILHPSCVLPAEKKEIPVRLKCTSSPGSPGTLISDQVSDQPITAIAAKDGITAIKIYSHRMLMAYGFLRKVFQVFEDYATPIDMITTSEVAVSLTIDQGENLEDILTELNQFSEAEAQNGYTILCLVGNALYDDPSYVEQLFHCLEKIPLRMISMGGSKYNISLLIQSIYKKRALRALNGLFESVHMEVSASI